MIRSACVVLWNEARTHVLSIAAHHRPGEWTLPGGSVDPGESPRDAAARELREETGIDAVLSDEPCFCGPASPSGTLCAAFTATSWQGQPADSAEGRVAWVEPGVVLGCRYADFNRAALAASLSRPSR